MIHPKHVRLSALAGSILITIAACSSASSPAAGGPSGAPLSGTITIDGSSTVYPITLAVAEDFQKANTGVKVTVAFAGTATGPLVRINSLLLAGAASDGHGSSLCSGSVSVLHARVPPGRASRVGPYRFDPSRLGEPANELLTTGS